MARYPRIKQRWSRGLVTWFLRAQDDRRKRRSKPDEAATALLARMSAAPSDSRKAAIDDLVSDLKRAGIWVKLDGLYVLAAHDAQAARLNWIGGQFDLSEVSAPSFTADRGYQGNGTSSYLDTGFNPTTAGGKFSQNDAHIGVWSLTDLTNDTAFDIGNTLARLNSRSTTGTSIRGTLNRSGNLLSGSPTANSLGHHVLSRSASTVLKYYKGAEDIATSTAASTGMSNETLRVGAAATFYSARRLSAAHFGRALTAADVSLLNVYLDRYMAAVGAI